MADPVPCVFVLRKCGSERINGKSFTFQTGVYLQAGFINWISLQTWALLSWQAKWSWRKKTMTKHRLPQEEMPRPLCTSCSSIFFSFLKVPSSQNNKVVPYMDSNFKLSPGGGCISITELLNKGILICSSIGSEPCFQTAELCYQTFVSWTHLSSPNGSVINFVSIELVRYCSMLYKTCVLWE